MSISSPAPVIDTGHDPAVLESISRSDYTHREHLGLAGPTTALEGNPVLERWSAEFPHWRARYWTYRPDPDTGALLLFPLNVRRRTHTR